MARINDISVYFINNIPIREDRRNNIDQTYKFDILKNGAYYVHICTFTNINYISVIEKFKS